MGQIKVTQDRPLAPAWGWTRQDYEKALTEGARRPVPTVPAIPATPVEALLRAVGTGARWKRDALCIEFPDVDWFAFDEAPARAICQRCLVRQECLAGALEQREEGIWGGTNAKERSKLRAMKVA